jgi:predicted AAA+ superfamily ATPase
VSLITKFIEKPLVFQPVHGIFADKQSRYGLKLSIGRFALWESSWESSFTPIPEKSAFLFSLSKRCAVKGRAYFDSPSKYYCEDIGLRNARIGFRQQEMTHIMENILYNELNIRGFAVDVGVVYSRELNQNGNSIRVPREIDFIVNGSGKRTYIQGAYAMDTEEKRRAEVRPFSLIDDSFPKIIVRKDIGKRWYDDDGILNIGLVDFLLDDSVI